MVTIIIKIDTCTSTRRICFPNLMIFSSMASLNGSGLPDTSSLISYHRFENLPSGLNPVRKFAPDRCDSQTALLCVGKYL